MLNDEGEHNAAIGPPTRCCGSAEPAAVKIIKISPLGLRMLNCAGRPFRRQSQAALGVSVFGVGMEVGNVSRKAEGRMVNAESSMAWPSGRNASADVKSEDSSDC